MAALALYAIQLSKTDGLLRGLFVMRKLLAELLTHRIPVESHQRAPKLIEVLAPRVPWPWRRVRSSARSRSCRSSGLLARKLTRLAAFFDGAAAGTMPEPLLKVAP
jgi:hypothetical protein